MGSGKCCVKKPLWHIFFKTFSFITLLLIFNTSINFAYANSITRSSKYSALVMDSSSGEIIYAKNAHELRYPASLTKMMTLYLTFEALASGKLTMNQKIVVSHKAALQTPLKLGVKAGEKISVRDCIYAAIILSANDAVVVLAEAIAGGEWSFAKMMTEKAKRLGMIKTNFANSHGLHDNNQYTTAADMAKLALALKKNFPQYYPLFSKTSFTYKGKVIKGHNHVTKKYEGAEGLKTGYIRTSGYNLVTTAKKTYGHLVGVVFGGPTAKARDDHMMNILDLGFCHISQKNGHYNPKCKNTPSIGTVSKGSPSNKDIFSVVEEQKPIRVASLDTKKFTSVKSKSSPVQNKKNIRPASSTKKSDSVSNINLKNKKHLKQNHSKKAVV